MVVNSQDKKFAYLNSSPLKNAEPMKSTAPWRMTAKKKITKLRNMALFFLLDSLVRMVSEVMSNKEAISLPIILCELTGSWGSRYKQARYKDTTHPQMLRIFLATLTVVRSQ